MNKSCGQGPRSDPEGGFVQLLALVALATIGGVVTASSIMTNTSNRAGGALERLIRAEALSTSGFFRLEAAIVDALDNLELNALGDQRPTIQIGDDDVELRIEAENGKIDVLLADEQILSRYLTNAGLVSPQSVLIELAGERERGNGDSALALIRRALAEWDEIPFWEDFTHFGSRGIDPRYASGRVLQALPDLTSDQAATLARMAPERRAESTIWSTHFISGGTRFSLVAIVDWSRDETSQWRLPVELSASGRVLRLGGPSL